MIGQTCGTGRAAGLQRHVRDRDRLDDRADRHGDDRPLGAREPGRHELVRRQAARHHHERSFDLVTGPLAGSDAGTHDVDGGQTSIRSPQITVPAGTRTLTFSWYLAHGSNSSSQDYFRVQGQRRRQVFQQLGAAANRNGAWTTTTVRSRAATVQITFEAADLGTASLVEAGVDDVVIR